MPDLQAPVTAGSKAGQMVVLLNGAEIGRIDLLCGETVLPKLESALRTLKLSLPQ